MKLQKSKRLKILIFGGSGLLGSHLVKNYSTDNDVIWTYSSPLKNINNGISYVYGDKNSDNALMNLIEQFNPDVIINAIGLVSVDQCETNFKLAEKLNSKFVKSIVDILHKIKNNNNCYFVQISSGGVYGNHSESINKSWKEADKLNPLSNYALTKVQGEWEAKKYLGPKLIIRSDFYGLNYLRQKSSLLSWIIYNTENNIQMSGWENVFFSPISGNKLSDIIMQCIKRNIEGVFNIGSENGCSKFEFVEAVCKKLNLEPNIIKNEVISKIRPRSSILCCKKIKKFISFSCDWKIELEKYIDDVYLR